MLVIFSGGSGVGKNTVIERLLANGEFALMPTYTTRQKREKESEGNPYFFISNELFLEKLKEGEFYEHELVHNHYYGTSRRLLQESLKSGKILLKDIDVKGTQNLLKKADADTEILTIFLRVDSVNTLIERLKARGEKDIELRLKRYSMEQEYAVGYDYIITNDDLNKTVATVLKVIEAERNHLKLLSSAAVDNRAVDGYVGKLKDGEKLKPVKVTLKDGELYVVEGCERYQAALLTGKRIAKEIV